MQSIKQTLSVKQSLKPPAQPTSSVSGFEYFCFKAESALSDWTIRHNYGTKLFLHQLTTLDGDMMIANINAIDEDTLEVQVSCPTAGILHLWFPKIELQQPTKQFYKFPDPILQWNVPRLSQNDFTYKLYSEIGDPIFGLVDGSSTEKIIVRFDAPTSGEILLRYE